MKLQNAEFYKEQADFLNHLNASELGILEYISNKIINRTEIGAYFCYYIFDPHTDVYSQNIKYILESKNFKVNEYEKEGLWCFNISWENV